MKLKSEQSQVIIMIKFQFIFNLQQNWFVCDYVNFEML